MIPLWRNNPILAPSLSGKVLENNVFPSGRQSLSYCLEHAGLSRKDRVAIPEWSSHCVISAIGKIATPIPIKEVIRFDIDVSAVLIYDQWGWPMLDNCKGIFGELFKDKIIIHDAVDTINIFGDNKLTYSEFENIYSVFSLSKTLGLEGGAIVSFNREYLNYIPKSYETRFLIEKIEGLTSKKYFFSDFMKHIIRSEIPCLQTKLIDWIKTNSVVKAIEVEKLYRKKNINIMAKHGLTDNWPEWLMISLSKGVTPGIIPLLIKSNRSVLLKLQAKLAEKCNIKTEIYNFDWNGNIVKPDYQECIAIPVHGEVENMSTIVDTVLSFKV